MHADVLQRLIGCVRSREITPSWRIHDAPLAILPYPAISEKDSRPCRIRASASLRTSGSALRYLPLKAHSQITITRHSAVFKAARTSRSRSMFRLILVFQNVARVFGHLNSEHL